MGYLEWLQRVLAGKLADKTIGTPVALRITLQITSDHGLLAPLAASGLVLAEAWFQSPVRRVFTQGGPEEGYLTVLAEFAAGQTAWASAELIRENARPAPEFPAVSLWALGNHGSVTFDDRPTATGFEVSLQPLSADRAAALRALIEQSRRSREPAAAPPA